MRGVLTSVRYCIYMCWVCHNNDDLWVNHRHKTWKFTHPQMPPLLHFACICVTAKTDRKVCVESEDNLGPDIMSHQQLCVLSMCTYLWHNHIFHPLVTCIWWTSVLSEAITNGHSRHTRRLLILNHWTTWAWSTQGFSFKDKDRHKSTLTQPQTD